MHLCDLTAHSASHIVQKVVKRKKNEVGKMGTEGEKIKKLFFFKKKNERFKPVRWCVNLCQKFTLKKKPGVLFVYTISPTVFALFSASPSQRNNSLLLSGLLKHNVL